MTRADHLGGIFPFRSLSLREQCWSIGFILSFLGLAFSQALFTITLFGLSIAVVVEQLQKGAPSIFKENHWFIDLSLAFCARHSCNTMYC